MYPVPCVWSQTPTSPSAIAIAKASSASIAKVTSHAAAVSFGDDPYFAPSLTRASHLVRALFHTVTLHPALIRLRDIAKPIIPTPRNPTVGKFSVASDIELARSLALQEQVTGQQRGLGWPISSMTGRETTDSSECWLKLVATEDKPKRAILPGNFVLAAGLMIIDALPSAMR